MEADRAAALDPDRPTPELLVRAYSHGVFPMADPVSGRMEWFSPDPRAIIPLDGFRTPRSLLRTVRRGDFEIRTDTAFEAVIRACGRPRGADNPTWIDERIIRAYCGLHERGLAHAIEAWRCSRLVGGLYGVHIGAAFFGESMFVRPDLGGTDASKVCLVHLVDHLRRRGFSLLDTQFSNDHIAQFGAIEIPRAAYLARLAEAVGRRVAWTPFGAPEA
jgi:leucyl/phenylalanyl-tRNA--protein transferase